jgi:ABC-2 type transport system permease protein
MKHILTVISKEWEEALRNKLILYTVILVPLFMLVVPLVMLFLMGRLGVSESDLQELGRVLNDPRFQGMDPVETMQSVMTGNMLTLFLMMPLLVPVTIASYSIVGEKVSRSLEPLLATPITTTELLLGKGLAAALPGVIMLWAAYGIFLVAARFLAASPRVFSVFIDPMWVVAMFVLAPLLTILAVNLGIIISSRAGDPRSAEQMGAFVLLPLLILFIGGMSGLIALNQTTFWVTSAIIAVLDLVTLYFAVKLFQRETILTRWR